MSFTKDKLREIIDQENGEYFSLNIGLNGYIFSKNGSFIIFDIKNIENIQTCHIKYIYFDSIKSLRVLLTYSANFWMGNKVQFIFYIHKSVICNQRSVFRDHYKKISSRIKVCTPSVAVATSRRIL